MTREVSVNNQFPHVGLAGYFEHTFVRDRSVVERVAQLLVDSRWPWIPWLASFAGVHHPRADAADQRMRPRSRLIEWVHAHCLLWGRKIRRILDDDGYSDKSSFCMLADGRFMADDMTAGQHWPEFLTGEALAVAVAMKELSLEEPEVLFPPYVILGDASYKARMMMLPRRTYYNRLESGNRALSELLQLHEVAHFDTRGNTPVIGFRI